MLQDKEVEFTYDINAELEDMLGNKTQKQPAQIPTQNLQRHQNVHENNIAKISPKQFAPPEPQMPQMQQNGLTMRVPIGDTNAGKLQVLEDDPYLQHHENDLKQRVNECRKWLQTFKDAEGGLLNIGRSYKKYGLNVQPNGDITYKEWAPSANSISIFGEFNNWNREEFRAGKDDFGCFNITIPAVEGKPRIPHKTKYKINIEGPNGERRDRNSAWTRMAVQDKTTFLYDCFWWNPEEKFEWTHKRPIELPKQSVRIYEAHVGMAQEFGRVSTYRDFADYNLDRIKKAGYNYIQLMAIQEHSYYASFGYHVTNFFGVASRSGNPDDFKYLVNKAHSLGLRIIIDLVHSHASTNENDGIKQFDGTDHCYSHGGARGYHSSWDSMVFDYSKYEVKRFLLANLAWFLDEYNVDGFRFDAVTSILYNHHGIGVGFSGDYNEYFGLQTDLDGITYLMLANILIREITPDAITVAEDVSGMPTLCRSLVDGGIGFDYRLSMFMPDMWIKLMKTMDDDWNMGHITHSLTNRRWKEKVIGYAESHDQAIVGDKTISMHLFDAQIYTNMSILSECTPQVSRGMALHKMIRLISQSLGGEGYLNFMGNEFGHPEWIDFPREGNSDSYQHCRRQWNLMYDDNLRYPQLYRFDEKMNEMEILFSSMIKPHQYVSLNNEGDKVICYEKGDLVYIFNFHHSQSYQDYPIGTYWSSDHFILFESDEECYGGHKRLDGAHQIWFETHPYEVNQRPNHFKIYVPCRTCIVLCPYEKAYPLLKKNPQCISRMPQPTERQKQQIQQILATQIPETMQANNNQIKYEELKQTEMPQKTVVVKRSPAKVHEDPESDFVKQLMNEQNQAKQNLNQEDAAKKEAMQQQDMEKYQQIKKNQEKKFIDLMDDLGM